MADLQLCANVTNICNVQLHHRIIHVVCGIVLTPHQTHLTFSCLILTESMCCVPSHEATSEWTVTKSQRVCATAALLSVSRSSNSGAVCDASFSLRCHVQPPWRLHPRGFLFVWLPHRIGAMLHAIAFWVSPPPSTVGCLRVRVAINKHCALTVHSCVAQREITHAAWPAWCSALLHKLLNTLILLSKSLKYENRKKIF